MGPGLEARGKGSIMVEPKATLGIKTENQKPTQSEGQKQGIRSQRKEGKGIGDSFATASPFGPLAPSAPPWPAPQTPASSSHPFPSANTLVQSAQDVAAMAEALKEAYPDEGTRPQNVKDMIEKAERDAVKDVAKGLHSATKALSKAQKTLAENLEAKQQHRQDLVPLLQRLLAEVKSYMHDLGFTLNFARGKTSAVVSFRGKSAAAPAAVSACCKTRHCMFD